MACLLLQAAPQSVPCVPVALLRPMSVPHLHLAQASALLIGTSNP